MNDAQNLEQLQRALKGAPGAILWAFVLNAGPQTARMLSRHSGYSDRAARQGAGRLEEIGLVSYN